MFEISIILIFGQSTKAADTVVLTLAGGLLMVIGLFGSASRVLRSSDTTGAIGATRPGAAVQLLRLLVAQQTISACGTLKPGIDAARTFDEDAFCNDGELQRLGQCATISHGRRAG
jgi:hypothetical protein